MLRIVLGSKIHRATITGCDIEYEGSIEVDEDLLDKVDMIASEKVDIYNITNGARLSTYIITGKRGSGVIGVNGAAARLCERGDKVIIAAYRMIDEAEARTFKPRIIRLDESNVAIEQ